LRSVQNGRNATLKPMSKGLGKLQRAALDLILKSDEPLDSIEIAGRIFDVEAVEISQCVSVRRALNNLQKRGLIAGIGRRWNTAIGRRFWTTPQKAEEKRKRIAACGIAPGF
jgi:hypothetical protein